MPLQLPSDGPYLFRLCLRLVLMSMYKGIDRIHVQGTFISQVHTRAGSTQVAQTVVTSPARSASQHSRFAPSLSFAVRSK
jgi:hypothetical protein